MQINVHASRQLEHTFLLLTAYIISIILSNFVVSTVCTVRTSTNGVNHYLSFPFLGTEMFYLFYSSLCNSLSIVDRSMTIFLYVVNFVDDVSLFMDMRSFFIHDDLFVRGRNNTQQQLQFLF